MLLQREYRTRCGVIHYWISKKKDSEVTLVFLPGLTADHRLFDKQMAYFKGKYSVFVNIWFIYTMVMNCDNINEIYRLMDGDIL